MLSLFVERDPTIDEFVIDVVEANWDSNSFTLLSKKSVCCFFLSLLAWAASKKKREKKRD